MAHYQNLEQVPLLSGIHTRIDSIIVFALPGLCRYLPLYILSLALAVNAVEGSCHTPLFQGVQLHEDVCAFRLGVEFTSGEQSTHEHGGHGAH